MKLKIQDIETVGAIIGISGELDLYSTSEMRTKIQELLERKRTRIILDLSELSYLDSSGVGVLIFLLQALKTKGGKLAVFGLAGTPRKVLEMSNIISLLPLADSIDESREMVL